MAALDTDVPEFVDALDAAQVTLTLTRSGELAQVGVAERDFGHLTTIHLHADLRCARFTDPPRRFNAAEAFAGDAGQAVQTELLAAARPYLTAAGQQLPERLAAKLAQLEHAVAEGFDMVPLLQEAVADIAAGPLALPDTADGRRPDRVRHRAACNRRRERDRRPAHRPELTPLTFEAHFRPGP
ncbi:hypothetical protein Q3Y56_32890 [Streptomyces sp. XD-27]|nr:hypothetical protein [Streptomyces sp. XD-27]WKX74584.1 hypothetical protein Q3Y56_32890 [Streptomyces sp. XD-27]